MALTHINFTRGLLMGNEPPSLQDLINVMQSSASQIAWLIANTSATNVIIRALAEANADDPALLDALKKLHVHKAGNFLASAMTDAAIAEYEKALKELLPPALRAALGL